VAGILAAPAPPRPVHGRAPVDVFMRDNDVIAGVSEPFSTVVRVRLPSRLDAVFGSFIQSTQAQKEQ